MYRWIGTGVFLMFFFLRILLAQGWYIGAHTLPSATVAHPFSSILTGLTSQSHMPWASTC